MARTRIQNAITPAPAFLDEAAAAHFLQLSPRTLQHWRQTKGGPPYVKLGAAVRYEIEALRSWALEQSGEAA